MRSRAVVRVIWASGMLIVFGCGRLAPGADYWRSGAPEAGTESGGSSAGGVPMRGQGGAPSMGGRMSMGGILATAGRIETGGAIGIGGLLDTGGTIGIGGLLDTGGTPSTGGRIDTGGAPSTGGQLETGGAPTGGAIGSGGIEADGSAGAGGSPTTDGSASSGGSSDSGTPDASSSDAADARSERDAGASLLPVAARAGHWQWQGAQRELLRSNGSICASKIAIAVGGRGACFEDADDELECIGSVHTRDFGPTFVKTGIRNVDQVSMSAGPNTGNDLCAHTGGTLQCFGVNANGQFGTGANLPEPDLVPWGGKNDIVAFATGTWSDICVLDQQGAIFCAGTRYGTTPVSDHLSGHTSMWMNTSSVVFPDDSTLLRADQSRTECKVTTLGLECTPTTLTGSRFGTPGSIVMGGAMSAAGGSFPLIIGRAACWLESSGDVYCGVRGVIIVPDGQFPVFAGRPALALATQYYSSQICAVFADASVECVRVAVNTGAATPVAVAPPGSAMIGCQ